MTSATVDQITAATKANADALTKSGNAVIAGFQELAKAYQTLATRNAEKLTSSIQALSSVKSPTEFVELQQKLIKEAVDAAVADSREIANLTAAVFTSAFEPVQKQVEALQKTVAKK
jgi:phasin family protein